MSEVVAYVVAVAAATLVMQFVFRVQTGDDRVFSLFPLFAIFVMMCALPGTLISRLILSWRQWDGFVAHAVAGATVGGASGAMLELFGTDWHWRDNGRIALASLLAGLAGGVVFHAVRRLQRPRVADGDPTQQGRSRE